MAKGPIHNVFIATPAQACCGFVGVPSGEFLAAELKFIDVAHVESLQATILTYSNGAQAESDHKTIFIWTESNGPWLKELPAVLVSTLAAVPKSECRRMGLRWWAHLWADDDENIRTEMMAQAPAELLEREVSILVDFSRLAIALGKKVYWVAPGC